jgi:lysozyme
VKSRERSLLVVLAAAAALLLFSRSRAGQSIIQAIMDKGASLVKRFEGLRLTAYQDVAGLWTVGYGHLVRPGERFHPYGPVKTITEEEASALLAADMTAARNAIASAVRVELTGSERAALESLAFNIGSGAFANSTLVKKLNAGDREGAADQFLVWNRAGGQVVQGLVNRRAAERTEFLS